MCICIIFQIQTHTYADTHTLYINIVNIEFLGTKWREI